MQTYTIVKLSTSKRDWIENLPRMAKPSLQIIIKETLSLSLSLSLNLDNNQHINHSEMSRIHDRM